MWWPIVIAASIFAGLWFLALLIVGVALSTSEPYPDDWDERQF